jgi:hypothetical protein
MRDAKVSQMSFTLMSGTTRLHHTETTNQSKSRTMDPMVCGIAVITCLRGERFRYGKQNKKA